MIKNAKNGVYTESPLTTKSDKTVKNGIKWYKSGYPTLTQHIYNTVSHVINMLFLIHVL